MKFKIIILIINIFFLGCSFKNMPLDKQTKETLIGKTIIFIDEDKQNYPKLIYPMIGALGGLLISGTASGSTAIEVAPSTYINEKITPTIIEKYKMLVTNDEKKANYILSTDTSWSVSYSKKYFGAYYLKMINDVRLKDKITDKVVSQFSCRYTSKVKDGSPTHDEMLGNDAKLMKEMSYKVLNQCIENINQHMLK